LTHTVVAQSLNFFYRKDRTEIRGESSGTQRSKLPQVDAVQLNTVPLSHTHNLCLQLSEKIYIRKKFLRLRTFSFSGDMID